MQNLGRAWLGLLAALVSLSFGAPAMGQGRGTTCVEDRLSCAASGLDSGSSKCADYSSCFVEASESLYYLVDGRRFDCDGLDCAQAREELNAFCCPRQDSDAGAAAGPVKYSNGCSFACPMPQGEAWLAAAGLALVSLLTLRRRAQR